MSESIVLRLNPEQAKSVIPAKAGIHLHPEFLHSGFRRNDDHTKRVSRNRIQQPTTCNLSPVT